MNDTVKKRLAIIGSKEFGMQVKIYAERTGNFDVVGYIDDFAKEGSVVEGVPVIGTIDKSIEEYKNGLFDCAFVAVGYNSFEGRECVYNRVKGIIPLANIIVGKPMISKGVTLGEGILITDYCFIDKNVVIDDNVVILVGTVLGHDSLIGKHTYFAGRNSLAGFSRIGERCFIGVGAVIADHMEVCSDVWIGIGCIVARSITVSGKYISTSARLIRLP